VQSLNQLQIRIPDMISVPNYTFGQNGQGEEVKQNVQFGINVLSPTSISEQPIIAACLMSAAALFDKSTTANAIESNEMK
jgi:hypothetical protein